jgi:hypothetical protein
MTAEPRIEPLSEGERKWIEAHLRIARSFVALYTGVEPSGALPTPDVLDAAWAGWLPQWEAQDPNAIINAVGMVIGEHLIAALGLMWVVATDEHGSELAVHGEPCNVLVFPANLVGKRFASRTTGFIAPLLEQMIQDVRRMRAEEVPN